MPKRYLPSEVLDASHIAGELWMGSFPPLDGRLSSSTDLVIFAAEELQPENYRRLSLRTILAPLSDDGQMLDASQWRIAYNTARHARKAVDMNKRVLVTCHAGLNRSGLIAAIVLMLPPTSGVRIISTPACLPSSEAIKLVRRGRNLLALSNAGFIKHLRRLDGTMCRGRHPTFAPPVYL